MTSFMICTGISANYVLPALMTGVTSGSLHTPEQYRVISIGSAPLSAELCESAKNFNILAETFGKDQDHPFFHTSFNFSDCRPHMPTKNDLLQEDESSDLLYASLFGLEKEMLVSEDPVAAQLSLGALLHREIPEELSSFLTAFDQSFCDNRARLMIVADPADPEGSGFAFALARFLRKRYIGCEMAPFLGLVLVSEPSSHDDPDRRLRISHTLAHISEHKLIRPAEGRNTLGFDAGWLFDLPAGCLVSDPLFSPAVFSAAMALNHFFTAPDHPSFGIHTANIPGTLTWHSFGEDAPARMAYIRSSVWMLTDLLPALEDYLKHPSLLKSIAPFSRGSLYRKFFKDVNTDTVTLQDRLSVLVHCLKGTLLFYLESLRTMPDILRKADNNQKLWNDAVRACGRAVTLAAEYDVDHEAAIASGLDKVRPVHRDSMADTEEERSLRRLHEMSDELNVLLQDREKAFTALGGFRSRQVLEDCLARCGNALTKAESTLSALYDSAEPDRGSILQTERRVLTLRAAVHRCENDLKKSSAFPALSELPVPRLSLTEPWACELINAELAPALYSFLTSENASEEKATLIRDRLHELFPDFRSSDVKNLLKACINQTEVFFENSFSGFCRTVWSILLEETSQYRVLPDASEVPDIPLLPDLTVGENILTVSSAPGRILSPVPEQPDASRRGLLAMLLLSQYRRRTEDDPSIGYRLISPDSSPFANSWLDTLSSSGCIVITLIRNTVELPFAILLPKKTIITARLSLPHLPLIPGFVSWFDPTLRRFMDPSSYLGLSDRTLLTEQLVRLRALLRNGDFSDFLHAFHRDIMSSVARRNALSDPALVTRLRAICGLRGLPAFSALTRTASLYDRYLKEDPLCAMIAGEDSVPAPKAIVEDDVIYSWQGIPFARENSETLLETTHHPDEEDILAYLSSQCELLTISSDTYHENLRVGLMALKIRCPHPVPFAEEIFSSLTREADQPITEKITEYTWPWDSDSPALRSIFAEAFAPRPADCCLDPFSKKLALIPRHGHNLLGDKLLSDLCVLKAEAVDDPEAVIPDDAVLPPFSASFASLLCETAEGSTLLTQDLLTFSRSENGIRVELLLHANFDLKLIRTYAQDEILTLYSHDIPTVALWPSLPLPANTWKSYYVFGYMPGNLSLSMLSQGISIPLSCKGDRYADSTDFFPSCLLVEVDGQSLAALPNLLPIPEIKSDKHVTACVDYGSSATSVVLVDEEGPRPLTGDIMIRTLLHHPIHSADLLRRQFLPAVPVAPILPSTAQIFRNVPNSAPVPFVDGSVFMPAALKDVTDVDAHSLYTSLKWSFEKGRSSDLCLHQIMLLTALQARLDGAESLVWRFALPDHMAEDGKNDMISMLRNLAQAVSVESMLPSPALTPLVAFASETEALGSYFRLCCPEETRSGFMVLDIGSATTEFGLFLRGFDTAALSCQFPLGIHYFLFPSLLKVPDLLMKDFGYGAPEDLMSDLQAMCDCFTAATSDPGVLRKARLMLDTFIADRFVQLRDLLVTRPGGCASTRSGSLMLLYFAWLMAITGVMVLRMSLDSTRNDFLPQQMLLYCAGRGSHFMEGLTDNTRNKLWKFLNLYTNTHVFGTSLRFSGEKKMEIAAGLSGLPFVSEFPNVHPAASTDLPVRPDDLLYRFLYLFLLEFPGAAPAIFPDWFVNDTRHPFTAGCEVAVEAAVRSAFGSVENTDPYTALASCLPILLESADSLF